MIGHRKDLLGLEDLSAEEITSILDTARTFREVLDRPIPKVPALRGLTAANLFFEGSTRTRLSFELAEKRLSADTVHFQTSGSSVSKGETLRDTARNIEAMGIHLVVIRHQASARRRGSSTSSRSARSSGAWTGSVSRSWATSCIAAWRGRTSGG